MAIYKVVKGKKVELTATEIKNKIMQWQGWNAQQYKREYNIIRNKLRNFEQYNREHGINVNAQSPQSFIYFESRKMHIEGANYAPSMKMQLIKSFSARSTSKKVGLKAQATMNFKQEQYVNRRFAGLINANAKAREISLAISDPVKREKALADFANELHLKIKKSGEAESRSAIPFSQKTGSTEDIKFDYSAYLE